MAIATLLLAVAVLLTVVWHAWRSAAHRRRVMVALAHLCLSVDHLIDPDN